MEEESLALHMLSAGLNADLQRANEQLVLATLRSQESADLEAAEAEKARAVLESLPDVIARFDPELRCLYVNAAIEELAGRHRSDLLGKTNDELGAPPALVIRANLLLRKAFASGTPGEALFTFESPAKTRSFLTRTIPEIGLDGQVASVVVVVRDVTDSQLYLKAIEDAERLGKLQALSRKLAAARSPREVAEVVLAHGRDTLKADAGRVMLLDATGQQLELTASFGDSNEFLAAAHVLPFESDAPLSNAVRAQEPLFLETADALFARYPGELDIDPHIQALIASPLGFEDKSSGGLELDFRSARTFSETDRSFVLALTTQSAHAFDNARMLGVETDARREAESAGRLKDEFLGTMSHELRTPLNAMIGWSSLLRTQEPEPALLQRGLEAIERNARVQARLVDDVLDLARIDSGKLTMEMEITDVGAVLRAAIDVVHAAAAAKRIELSVSLGDVHMIMADPARVQQMFWNVLSNAVKFTPVGGRIAVTVSQRGSNVAIEVRDTGCGIDAAFLPHVFERFRQHDGSTTRRYGGLGLGVAIVRQIAALHGGTVTAESAGPGKGSCFTIELAWSAEPAAGTKSAVPAVSPARLTSLQLRGVRVMVVDDDTDARELTALALEGLGAHVSVLESGELALAALRSQQPDVIVCDIGMPDMDGYEFIRRLRLLPPTAGGGTPAIAVTGFVGQGDVRAAFSAGFQLHVKKPVELAALAEAISWLCASS